MSIMISWLSTSEWRSLSLSGELYSMLLFLRECDVKSLRAPEDGGVGFASFLCLNIARLFKFKI